ncbi:MFS transporter [Amycolatopsis sp.]|uniref:MFS transporter n=1 Tax=Amycolatopsis sp. TaxID=37632 RepID=UPI002C5AB5FD|nr:MFS transporter [Amycolatopsis sp.]HVV14375.1 MFS transporter [Amycolatopsis sp.]
MSDASIHGSAARSRDDRTVVAGVLRRLLWILVGGAAAALLLCIGVALLGSSPAAAAAPPAGGTSSTDQAAALQDLAKLSPEDQASLRELAKNPTQAKAVTDYAKANPAAVDKRITDNAAALQDLAKLTPEDQQKLKDLQQQNPQGAQQLKAYADTHKTEVDAHVQQTHQDQEALQSLDPEQINELKKLTPEQAAAVKKLPGAAGNCSSSSGATVCSARVVGKDGTEQLKTCTEGKNCTAPKVQGTDGSRAGCSMSPKSTTCQAALPDAADPAKGTDSCTSAGVGEAGCAVQRATGTKETGPVTMVKCTQQCGAENSRGDRATTAEGKAQIATPQDKTRPTKATCTGVDCELESHDGDRVTAPTTTTGTEGISLQTRETGGSGGRIECAGTCNATSQEGRKLEVTKGAGTLTMPTSPTDAGSAECQGGQCHSSEPSTAPGVAPNQVTCRSDQTCHTKQTFGSTQRTGGKAPAATCDTGQAGQSGSCRLNVTDAKVPPATAPQKTTIATASCSGPCQAGGTADSTTARADCHTDAGTCDTGIGGAASGQPSNGKPGADQANSVAHCQAADYGCGIVGTVKVDQPQSGGTAQTEVGCDTGATHCTGSGTANTGGQITGAAVRTTTGTSSCQSTAGACTAESTSTATGTRSQTPSADSGSSTASAQTDCAVAECRGAATSATSGGGYGDVRGVRESSGSADCTVQGGACGSTSGTAVSERKPVTGPVTASTGNARINCSAGTQKCGGTAKAATSGLDTAESLYRRESTSDTGCTVQGGACGGQAYSAASSAPDQIPLDPATGRQPTTGPSSIAQATGRLDCAHGCTGTATSSGSGVDYGVLGGKAQGSSGKTTCAGTGAACGGTTSTVASAFPGATTRLAADDHALHNTVTPDAVPAGPSSASVATALLNCAKGCNGTATSSATGTDGVSVRGSDAEVSCNLTGGVCRAGTRSAASASQDVAKLLPEPAGAAAPAKPATGPSTLSDAVAVTDCGTDCVGGVRAVTRGSDAPVAGAPGAAGSRGPPTTSESGTTSTCVTGADRCQAVANADSATGAGVNYLVDPRAGQALAAIREVQPSAPPTGAHTAQWTKNDNQDPPQPAQWRGPLPATISQSTGYAFCGGPDCSAGLTSRSTTGGPSDAAGSISRANSTCAGAAAGCMASGNGLATTTADPTKTGQTQAGATLACPEGCTGQIRTDTISAAKPRGGAVLDAVRNLGALLRANGSATDPISVSVAHSENACLPGAGACTATGSTTGSATVSAAKTQQDGRFGTTSATAEGICTTGNGLCPTSATSTTVGTDDPGTILADLHTRTAAALPATAHAIGASDCTSTAACQAGSEGFAGDHVAEATAGCATLGCAARTEGHAVFGGNRADMQTHCTTECTVTGRVGAADTSAEVSAGCTGTDCAYRYAAQSAAASAARGNQANAHAGCVAAGGVGSGWCVTNAVAQTGPGYAAAAAGCQGSAGSGCTYGYRAHSAATASAAGASARAQAAGSGGGTFGQGQVQTTAAATAEPGSAQAAASCTGSPGTRCGYSYSASATAGARDPQTGSWAQASARGSGSGGLGGGGVAVAAQAFAQGGHARADASCTGAPNCTANYTAHGEASAHNTVAPTDTEPGGHWDAHAEGTCSGTGNGGCGVDASAETGADGGAYATCSGNCANYVSPRPYNNFTQTAEPLGTRAAPQHGGAAPPQGTTVEGAPDGTRGISYALNPDGSYTVVMKDAHGNPVTATCAAPCKEGTEFNGPGGQHFEMDDSGPHATDPSVPGKPADTVTSDDNGGLLRNERGEGQGWVGGSGEITDGASGSRVTYRGGGTVRNDVTFAGPAGTPFKTTCNGGCAGEISNIDIGHGQWTDHIDFAGTPNLLTGRDGFGHAGKFDFTGKGTFTSDEGDVITAGGDGLLAGQARTFITTRDAFGLPGSYSILDGQTGSIALPGGWKIAQTVASSQIVDPPRVTMSIYGASTTPDMSQKLGENNRIEVTTPNGAGQGGSIACTGGCDLIRPAGMAQTPNCTDCEMFEPLAPLGQTPATAGWITNHENVTQRFIDPYGNWSECSSADCHIGMVYGPGGGAVCYGNGCDSRNVGVNGKSDQLTGQGALLFPTADGRHTGRACNAVEGRSCTSTIPNDLGWRNPDASWMSFIDPSYTRPALDTATDRQLADLLGVRRGDPLPPLSPAAVAELRRTDPKLADQYEASLPKLTPGRLDSAALTFVGAESTLQSAAGDLQAMTPQLQGALDAQRAANAGGLTDAEVRALDPQLETIRKANAMGRDIHNARAIVDGVDGLTYQRPLIGADQQQMAGTANLPGATAYLAKALGVDEHGNPLPVPHAQLGGDRATELAAQQTAQAQASQIAGLALIPRQNDLGRRQDIYNAQVTAYNNSETRSPLERQRLDGVYAGLLADEKAVNGVVDRIQALSGGPSAAVGDLRNFDVAFADASGDHTMADRLRQWNGLQTESATLAAQMGGSGDPNQTGLAPTYQSFSDVAGLNYNTIARDQGSRAPDSKLGTLSLPSTGRPDVLFAMTSAINKPTYDTVSSDSLLGRYLDTGVEGDPFIGSTPADRRAALASQGTPQQILNDLSARATANLRPGDLSQAARNRIHELGGGPVDVLETVYEDPKSHKLGYLPLYRVGTDGGFQYVDDKGAHYSGRQDFRDNNELFSEKTQWLAPTDLSRPIGDLNLAQTTGRHVSGTERALDRAAGVATVVGGVALMVAGTAGTVASGGALAPAMPAVYAGGMALTTAGMGYFTYRATDNIIERRAHGQSNSFANPAARADYIMLGSTAAMAASGGLSKVAGVAAARGAASLAPGEASLGSKLATWGAKGASNAALTGFGEQTGEAAYNTITNWHDMTGGEQKDAVVQLGMNAAMLGMTGATMHAQPAQWMKASSGPGIRAALADSGRFVGSRLTGREYVPTENAAWLLTLPRSRVNTVTVAGKGEPGTMLLPVSDRIVRGPAESVAPALERGTLPALTVNGVKTAALIRGTEPGQVLLVRPDGSAVQITGPNVRPREGVQLSRDRGSDTLTVSQKRFTGPGVLEKKTGTPATPPAVEPNMAAVEVAGAPARAESAAASQGDTTPRPPGRNPVRAAAGRAMSAAADSLRTRPRLVVDKSNLKTSGAQVSSVTSRTRLPRLANALDNGAVRIASGKAGVAAAEKAAESLGVELYSPTAATKAAIAAVRAKAEPARTLDIDAASPVRTARDAAERLKNGGAADPAAIDNAFEAFRSATEGAQTVRDARSAPTRGTERPSRVEPALAGKDKGAPRAAVDAEPEGSGRHQTENGYAESAKSARDELLTALNGADRDVAEALADVYARPRTESAPVPTDNRPELRITTQPDGSVRGTYAPRRAEVPPAPRYRGWEMPRIEQGLNGRYRVVDDAALATKPAETAPYQERAVWDAMEDTAAGLPGGYRSEPVDVATGGGAPFAGVRRVVGPDGRTSRYVVYETRDAGTRTLGRGPSGQRYQAGDLRYLNRTIRQTAVASRTPAERAGAEGLRQALRANSVDHVVVRTGDEAGYTTEHVPAAGRLDAVGEDRGWTPSGHPDAKMPDTPRPARERAAGVVRAVATKGVLPLLVASHLLGAPGDAGLAANLAHWSPERTAAATAHMEPAPRAGPEPDMSAAPPQHDARHGQGAQPEGALPARLEDGEQGPGPFRRFRSGLRYSALTSAGRLIARENDKGLRLASSDSALRMRMAVALNEATGSDTRTARNVRFDQLTPAQLRRLADIGSVEPAQQRAAVATFAGDNDLGWNARAQRLVLAAVREAAVPPEPQPTTNWRRTAAEALGTSLGGTALGGLLTVADTLPGPVLGAVAATVAATVLGTAQLRADRRAADDQGAAAPQAPGGHDPTAAKRDDTNAQGQAGATTPQTAKTPGQAQNALPQAAEPARTAPVPWAGPTLPGQREPGMLSGAAAAAGALILAPVAGFGMGLLAAAGQYRAAIPLGLLTAAGGASAVRAYFSRATGPYAVTSWGAPLSAARPAFPDTPVKRSADAPGTPAPQGEPEAGEGNPSSGTSAGAGLVGALTEGAGPDHLPVTEAENAVGVAGTDSAPDVVRSRGPPELSGEPATGGAHVASSRHTTVAKRIALTIATVAVLALPFMAAVASAAPAAALVPDRPAGTLVVDTQHPTTTAPRHHNPTTPSTPTSPHAHAHDRGPWITGLAEFGGVVVAVGGAVLLWHRKISRAARTMRKATRGPVKDAYERLIEAREKYELAQAELKDDTLSIRAMVDHLRKENPGVKETELHARIAKRMSAKRSNGRHMKVSVAYVRSVVADRAGTPNTMPPALMPSITHDQETDSVIDRVAQRRWDVLSRLIAAAHELDQAEHAWETAADKAARDAATVAKLDLNDQEVVDEIGKIVANAKAAMAPAADSAPASSGQVVDPPKGPLAKWLAKVIPQPRGPPAALVEAVRAPREIRDRAMAVVRERLTAQRTARTAWEGERPALVSAIHAARPSLPLTELARATRLSDGEVQVALADPHAPRATPAWLTSTATDTQLLQGLARTTQTLLSTMDKTTEALLATQAAADGANTAYLHAIEGDVKTASAAGLSNETIARLTGTTRNEIAAITRVYEAEPGDREPFVDVVMVPVLTRVSLLVAWLRGRSLNPQWEAELAKIDLDTISTQDLQAKLRGLNVPVELSFTLGRPRRDLGKTFDVHLHHIGYSDDRFAMIEVLLRWLAGANHLGQVWLSPIPQRGKAPAAAGGMFYYLVIGLLQQGVLFGKRLLWMRGTGTDVRLFRAVANLPPDLRWRVQPGVSGQRMDIPGALDYLRTILVFYPGAAALLAETTIAKEAVQILLGSQGAYAINPEYERYVGLLVAAVNQIKNAQRVNRLIANDLQNLPPGLARLLLRPNQVDKWTIAETLQGNIDELRTLLAKIGERRLAASLPHRAPTVYNKNLEELFEALAKTGQAIVLHNDAGKARLDANGRYVEAEPDGRNLLPVLALLSEPRFADVKVVYAHAMGLGKFSTASKEHFEWLDWVLANYPQINVDISWNEIARHILATEAIKKEFLTVARKYPDRFMFGSDAVKPAGLAHYLRHYNDLEPLFRELGDEIVAKVTYRNAAKLMQRARQDTAQWAFDEIKSGLWDQVLARVPERQAIVAQWVAAQELAGRQVTAPGSGPDIAVDHTGKQAWERNSQVRELISWVNLVNDNVVGNKGDPLRLYTYRVKVALGDTWADFRHYLAELRARWRDRDALRPAARLELGSTIAWTTAALIAAEQTATLHARNEVPQHLREGVWDRVDENELSQLAAATGMRRLVRHLHARDIRGWAVVLAVNGAAIAYPIVFHPQVPAVAFGFAASLSFVVRGALGQIRSAHVSQARIFQETMLERGRLDVRLIAWQRELLLKQLRREFGKHEIGKLNRIRAILDELVNTAEVLQYIPLSAQETPFDRVQLFVAEYSKAFDRINSVAGAAVAGAAKLGPHSGLLGKAMHTAVALTWEINLVVHAHTTLGAAVGSLAWFTNGAYVLGDIAFLVATLPTAINGWSGYDSSGNAIYRRLQHLLGFPVLTFANALLAVHLVLAAVGAPSAHGIVGIGAALILTRATYLLSKLGLAIELSLGRQATRRGVMANAMVGSSLASLGLMGLSQATWAIAVAAAMPALALLFNDTNRRIPVAKQRLAKTFGTLGNTNFRWFSGGQLVSNLGTQMAMTTQDLLILGMSHGNPAALGTVVFFQYLPQAVMSLWAGGLADRQNKRRLFIISQIGLAAAMAAQYALVSTAALVPWHLWALAAATGAFSSLISPVQSTFLHQLVGRQRLANATSITSVGANVARIGGPLLGAYLFGVWGAATVFLINAASYLVGATTLFGINKRTLYPLAQQTITAPATTGAFSRFREGLRYVRYRPALITTLGTMFAVLGFGATFIVSLPIVATAAFHRGAPNYGLLNTLLATGAVLGSALTARLSKSLNAKRLAVAAIALGGLNVALAVAPGYWVFALLLIPTGIALMSFAPASNSKASLMSADRVRGRVMSLFALLLLSSNMLKGALVPWLTSAYGPQSPFLIGGVITVIIGALTAPALIRADRVPHIVSEWGSDTITQLHPLVRKQGKAVSPSSAPGSVTTPALSGAGLLALLGGAHLSSPAGAVVVAIALGSTVLVLRQRMISRAARTLRAAAGGPLTNAYEKREKALANLKAAQAALDDVAAWIGEAVDHVRATENVSQDQAVQLVTRSLALLGAPLPEEEVRALAAIVEHTTDEAPRTDHESAKAAIALIALIRKAALRNLHKAATELPAADNAWHSAVEDAIGAALREAGLHDHPAAANALPRPRGPPRTAVEERSHAEVSALAVLKTRRLELVSAIGTRLPVAEVADAARLTVAEVEAHLAAAPKTEPTWLPTADPGTLRDALAAETARLLSTLDSATIREQTNNGPLEGLRVLPGTVSGKPRGRTFEALSVPNFRRFFLGQVISNLGTNMAIFAQDWLVLDLANGRTGALGIVTLAQFAPQVAITLVAGPLADRADKRRLLILSQAGVAVAMVAQGLLTATGLVVPWHIYLIAAAAGLFNALGGPVQSTLIRELVGKERLANATSLNSLNTNLGRVAGPMLGAVLLTLLGAAGVFLFNAASYVVVIGALLTINETALYPVAKKLNTAARGQWGEFREGLRYVRYRPALITMLGTMFAVLAFGATFLVTMPIVVKNAFHRGPGSYGLLNTMLSAGSVVGSTLAARQAHNLRARRLAVAAISLGVLNVALGLAPGYWSFAMMLVPAGIALMSFAPASNSKVSLSVADEFRGRVMSLFLLLLLAGNMFDGPWVTTLADTVGPQSPLLIGGIITAAAATLTAPYLIRHEKTPRDVSEWTADAIATMHTLLRNEKKRLPRGPTGSRSGGLTAMPTTTETADNVAKALLRVAKKLKTPEWGRLPREARDHRVRVLPTEDRQVQRAFRKHHVGHLLGSDTDPSPLLAFALAELGYIVIPDTMLTEFRRLHAQGLLDKAFFQELIHHEDHYHLNTNNPGQRVREHENHRKRVVTQLENARDAGHTTMERNNFAADVASKPEPDAAGWLPRSNGPAAPLYVGYRRRGWKAQSLPAAEPVERTPADEIMTILLEHGAPMRRARLVAAVGEERLAEALRGSALISDGDYVALSPDPSEEANLLLYALTSWATSVVASTLSDREAAALLDLLRRPKELSARLRQLSTDDGVDSVLAGHAWRAAGLLGRQAGHEPMVIQFYLANALTRGSSDYLLHALQRRPTVMSRAMWLGLEAMRAPTIRFSDSTGLQFMHQQFAATLRELIERGGLRHLDADALTGEWLSNALPEGVTSNWLTRWNELAAGERFTLGLLAGGLADKDLAWFAALPEQRQTQPELARFLKLLDGRLADYRDVLTRLFVTPDPYTQDNFVGSWLRLADLLIDLDPNTLKPAGRRHLLDVLDALAERLPETSPANRHRLLDARTATIRQEWRNLAERAPPGMDPQMWHNAFVHYRQRLAFPEFADMLDAYAATFRDTGSHARANGAAWRVWHQMFPRGFRGPNALAEAPSVHNGARTIVGVSRNIVETLHVGFVLLGLYEEGSWEGSVNHALYQEAAQSYVLHPQLAVVYAWERGPAGNLARVGHVNVLVTEHGILPVSSIYGWRARPELRAMFGDYLRQWAENTGRPLLLPRHPPDTMSRAVWPDLPGEAHPLTVSLAIPAAGGVEEIAADLIGHVRLPHTRMIDVLRWVPPGAR